MKKILIKILAALGVVLGFLIIVKVVIPFIGGIFTGFTGTAGTLSGALATQLGSCTALLEKAVAGLAAIF